MNNVRLQALGITLQAMSANPHEDFITEPKEFMELTKEIEEYISGGGYDLTNVIDLTNYTKKDLDS